MVYKTDAHTLNLCGHNSAGFSTLIEAENLPQSNGFTHSCNYTRNNIPKTKRLQQGIARHMINSLHSSNGQLVVSFIQITINNTNGHLNVSLFQLKNILEAVLTVSWYS